MSSSTSSDGLELTNVVSDMKHYSPFICNVCQNLVSLDVLVTPCNHPFCRTCFERWIQRRREDGLSCTCPSCNENLQVSSAIVGETFVVAKVPVRVRPLETAQPLAYQVLQQVQVSCSLPLLLSPSFDSDNGHDQPDEHNTNNTNGAERRGSQKLWIGDYADLKAHQQNYLDKHVTTTNATATATATATADATTGLGGADDHDGGGNISKDSSADIIETIGTTTISGHRPPGDELNRSTRSVDEDDSPQPEKPRSSRTSASAAAAAAAGTGALDARRKSWDSAGSVESETNPDMASPSSRKLPPTRTKSGVSTKSDDTSNHSAPSQEDGAEPVPGGRERERARLGQPGDRHGHRVSMRGDPTGAHHLRSFIRQGEDLTAPSTMASDDPQLQLDLTKASERCEKLKKQANAKFNRGDVGGARVLYSEGLALISNFPLAIDEVRLLTASLYSNRAVTFFRERILPPSVEDCDKSLELDPKCEKTYVRKWRALSAMGQFEAATACLEEGLKEIPDSAKLAEELKKAYDAPKSPAAQTKMTEYPNDMTYSLATTSALNSDSIAMPLSSNNNNDDDNNNMMQTNNDGSGSDLENDEALGDPSPEALERADKLKKQANAKFNKGDIVAARALYTDALCTLQPETVHHPNGGHLKTMMSPEIRELLSMLYSNRAVTFFRDKLYQESLEDCERAIELDPMTEKSYIRKGRALAALEMYDEACKCLERAVRLIPDSKKLAEELVKAQQQSEEEIHTLPMKAASDDEEDEVYEAHDDVDDVIGGDEDNEIHAASGHSSGREFANSAGSFNFYITPDNSRDVEKSKESPLSPPGAATAVPGSNYAADLELADKLKRNANAKFNRGDIAGARLLYTEALACLPNDRNNPEIRACLASLYANRAVTFFREKEFGPSTWDCDKAIELDPKSEKSYIRKARALSSLEKFDEAIKCLEFGIKQMPESHRLEEELSKALEQVAEHKTSDGESGMRGDATAESSNQDVAAGSAGSLSGMNHNAASLNAVAPSSSEDINLQMPSSDQIERAEKLKKQANAKLNKGDVAGARILYGEGLSCLPKDSAMTPEIKELAASLYANRAVTFFREKKFAATVLDCDRSLELDPKHEKSYVRKWRAHMALGNFEDAYLCLEKAVKEIPNSDRLTEELANATEQRDLLNSVNQLISAGEYMEARDTLKPLVKTSDNVSLWLAAARADACLGLTDFALERVNKVLLFNPKHVEGLQVRGYALFLSGQMEKGIALLQESRDLNPERENKSDIVEQLEKCQATFEAYSKGQGRVKRGRYKEAVEFFVNAIEDGDHIPKEAPLYGLLLTERAEASLLCQHYDDALADCIEAIRIRNDNLTAWTVKVEAYFGLGRLQEARDDLKAARRTWGAGNETIEEAYKKTDFELRLQKCDDDLHKLVVAVETGTTDGLPGAGEHDNRGAKRPSLAGFGGASRRSNSARNLKHSAARTSTSASNTNKNLVRRGSTSNVPNAAAGGAGTGAPSSDRSRGRKPRVPPSGKGPGSNTTGPAPRSYSTGRRKDKRHSSNGVSDLIQT